MKCRRGYLFAALCVYFALTFESTLKQSAELRFVHKPG
jgi:hypothetical protein